MQPREGENECMYVCMHLCVRECLPLADLSSIQRLFLLSFDSNVMFCHVMSCHVMSLS